MENFYANLHIFKDLSIKTFALIALIAGLKNNDMHLSTLKVMTRKVGRHSSMDASTVA